MVKDMPLETEASNLAFDRARNQHNFVNDQLELVFTALYLLFIRIKRDKYIVLARDLLYE